MQHGTESISDLGHPAESTRFKVYDLVEDAPPKNFHEAAERGDAAYMVRLIERTIDFNINLQVTPVLLVPDFNKATDLNNQNIVAEMCIA